MKQARILLFICFSLLFLAVSSQAATTERSGPQGAGKDEVLPVDTLFTGIADFFDDLVSGKKKSGADPEKDAKKEEPSEDKKKKKDASDAPYEIYQSPHVQSEYEVPAKEEEGTPASSLTNWSHDQVPSIDFDNPPPLPDDVKKDLKTKKGSQVTKELRVPTQKRMRAVPPISALPRQFFPVLPSGALPDSKPQLLPIATNVPLESDHTMTRRAIIIIHDIDRNASENLANIMTLAGNSDEEMFLLAPQFPLTIDIKRFGPYLPEKGANVMRWPISSGWQTGGLSFVPYHKKGISSFTAMDLLLMFLADRNRFPYLNQIVVVGHGAGADFVSRYAALGRAPDLLEKQLLPVRFIVANPSSYLYFTDLRLSPTTKAFTPFDTNSCPKVNNYPYGMDDLNDYGRRIGMNALRLRYPKRNVVYLVGDTIMTDHFLDRSCAANAQGNARLSRGKTYAQYLVHTFGNAFGKNQLFVFVPKAGYDPLALYASSCGIESIFGLGDCGQ